MEKRKYKLETSGCTNYFEAVRAIYACCATGGHPEDKEHFEFRQAQDAFANEELECSPSLSGYRKMIETLNSLGVEVYDLQRVQFPTLEPAEPKTLT